MKKHICIALSLAILILTSCHSAPSAQLPANSTPEQSDAITVNEITSTTATMKQKMTTNQAEITTSTDNVIPPRTTVSTKSKITTVKLTVVPTKEATRSTTAATTTVVPTKATARSTAATTTTVACQYLYDESKDIVPYTVLHTQKTPGDTFEAEKYKIGENQWLFDLIARYFPKEHFLDEWKIEIRQWGSNCEWSDEISDSVWFVTSYEFVLRRYINGIETDYFYCLGFHKENQDTYAGDAYTCEKIQANAPIYDPATMKTPHKLTAAEEKAFCKKDWDQVAELAEAWDAVPYDQTFKYIYFIAEDRLVFRVYTPYGFIRNDRWVTISGGSFDFDIE